MRRAPNGWVAAPDNVAFDPKGRIWISTDGQDDAAGFNDSLYAARDQRPQARRDALLLHRAGAAPRYAGPSSRPTARRCSSPIQHPGEGSTFDKPSTRWPDFRPDLPPRGSVIAITKDDGGEIGS